MTSLNPSPRRKSLRGGRERPTKIFYFSLRLAHSESASRASSPKLDARTTYPPSFTSWCHHFDTRQASICRSTRGAIPSAPRALRFCTGQQDQPLLLRLSMLFALALASRITTPRSLHLGWYPLAHCSSLIPASEPTSVYSAMVPST